MFSFTSHPIVDFLYPFCPSSPLFPPGYDYSVLCILFVLVWFGLLIYLIYYFYDISYVYMPSGLSCVSLFAALWTIAHQAPLSIGFSRQEYWSGLPCPPPGYLPDSKIKPHLLWLLLWQAGFLPLAQPGKPYTSCCQVALVMSSSVRPHRRQPTRHPPSLGFSRQVHWSGLPFPSPMHKSEKWKWNHSVVSDS